MDTNSSSSATPPSNILTATGSPGNQPQPPSQSFGSRTFRRIMIGIAVVGILAGGFVWYASRPETVNTNPQASAPANRSNAQPAATPAPSTPPTTGTTTQSSN